MYKPQAEMRLVVAALALLEQRFEQAAHQCFRDGGPSLATLQRIIRLHALPGAPMTVPAGGQKSTAFSMSLSSSWTIRSGAPQDKAGIFRRSQREMGAGKAVAISGHGGNQQVTQVEIHPLRLFDAFLDPRRRAQGAQDRLQALGSFAGARDVAALIVAQAFRLEIVQRRAHDGERRAQLMRRACRPRCADIAHVHSIAPAASRSRAPERRFHPRLPIPACSSEFFHRCPPQYRRHRAACRCASSTRWRRRT